LNQFSLENLSAIIDDRSTASAGTSYTKSLLDSGPERIAKKFGEEAVELVIALVSRDKIDITAEAADVLYHLLVVLKSANVSLASVLSELERRTTQSGLQEKAARNPAK
jgi:phosphoribosyl-ATP pyrophosphohydrolase